MARRMLSRSVTSPSTISQSGGTLPRGLDWRRSARTLNPSASKCLATAPPMNPLAPVTSTVPRKTMPLPCPSALKELRLLRFSLLWNRQTMPLHGNGAATP